MYLVYACFSDDDLRKHVGSSISFDIAVTVWVVLSSSA